MLSTRLRLLLTKRRNQQLFLSDTGPEFSKSFGWASGDRTGRYAIVVDHGKVTYAAADTVRGSIANSGAEGVLAKL